ncbi:FAD:protein FMN transferase [Aquimarina sp. 2201CG5-10]|uniref:FAD:protein FMN transferase n=1 Tax=Aquimarina callyspongiae TaxID=3098150 RepID=UPI002AB33BFA|nr:FAD:protein FMN transferase [Aquimarina sp. 2201CG5-10]MDY8136146.1 FAD:protein FMN transferase [Aquimarina sp. 2201CG5-10]
MTVLHKLTNQLYSFEHAAMATQFFVKILHHDKEYAQSVADQCFGRIDVLEHTLSRFIPDSDISRINKLEEGAHVLIDHETHECLKIAIEVMALTEGVFDIGMAEAIDVFRGYKKGILNATEYTEALKQVFLKKNAGSLYIDPETPKVYCVKEGIQIDLGGIGKGYALDQLTSILDAHDIKTYALSAGDSTLLLRNDPTQKPYWNYTLNSTKEEKLLNLSNTVISASGLYWSDKHIFDPKTGSNDITTLYQRMWISADKAVYADAFSTAFFLMPIQQIKETCKITPGIDWVAYSQDGNIQYSKHPNHISQ